MADYQELDEMLSMLIVETWSTLIEKFSLCASFSLTVLTHFVICSIANWLMHELLFPHRLLIVQCLPACSY